MRSLRALVGVAAVLAFLAVTSSASAAIIVDDFLTAFTPNAVLLAGPGGTDQSNFQSGAGITGSRRGGVQNLSGGGNITMQIDTSAMELIIGNAGASSADARLGYFIAGGLNVTGESELLFATASVIDDQGSAVEITAQLFSPGQSAMVTLSLTEAANEGLPVSFPLAAFQADNPLINLANITAVTFHIHLTDEQDLHFVAPLEFNGQNGGIPEPSSLLLWGSVALIGGWVSRRKLMKRAA